MGGDWHVVRGLGLLILTALVIAGVWISVIVAWLGREQFEVSFLFMFLPWMVMAAVAMILAWIISVIVTFINSVGPSRRHRDE